MIKNNTIFGIIAILATILCFVGCDDFEKELAYEVSSGQAEYIMLGRTDNTCKIKIVSPIKAEALKGEKITSGEIMLFSGNSEAYRETARIEKMSDSIYNLVAEFKDIEMGMYYSIKTNVQGSYINTTLDNGSFLCTPGGFVKITAMKQIFAAPDSVCYELALDNTEFLKDTESFTWMVDLLAKNQTYFYRGDIMAKDISDKGTAKIGFRLHKDITSGNYVAKLRNASNIEVQCSTSVPASTASISNLSVSVDIMGLRIKGDFDKGNQSCMPVLIEIQSKERPSGRTYIVKDTLLIDRNGFDLHPRIYPKYSQCNCSVLLKSINDEPIGKTHTLTLNNYLKDYAIDMGGDVLWANNNAVTTDENGKKTSLFLKEQCIDGDGDWRLPTRQELETLLKDYPSMSYDDNSVTIIERVSVLDSKDKAYRTWLNFPYSAYMIDANVYNNYSSNTSGYYWLQDDKGITCYFYVSKYQTGYYYKTNITVSNHYTNSKYRYCVRYVIPREKAMKLVEETTRY